MLDTCYMYNNNKQIYIAKQKNNNYLQCKLKLDSAIFGLRDNIVVTFISIHPKIDKKKTPKVLTRNHVTS